jgi:hypothetical protein
MDTGTGLFLGLVFCGTIFLYSQTKDRWNWSKLKKIGKWLAITLIALIIISIVYIYINNKEEKAQTIWESPKITNELMGIKLNDSFKDVQFKLGKLTPYGWGDDIGESYLRRLSTSDLELISSGKVEKLSDSGIKILSEKYPDLKKSIDGGVFGFNTDISPQKYLVVIVEENKIKTISFDCGNDVAVPDVVVNTVGCNASGEDLQKKFGNDIRILCKKNNTDIQRAYDVVRYGVRYHLVQNRVIGFSIAEPKVLETYIGNNYDKCE